MSDFPLPPAIIQAPPLVKRPRGLLLGVAHEVTEADVIAGRVETGITFCPQGCGELDAMENSWCDDVLLPTEGPDTPAAEEFPTFTIVGREDAPTWLPPELAQNRIINRFDTQTSAQVARELLTGATGSGPSLQSEVTDEVAGPVDLEDALYIIDQLLATVDNARGTIMATPGTFGLLANEYGIDEAGGIFTTPTGHYLVGDSGFDGGAPNGDVTAGESYVYAILGVPYFWLGPRKRIGDESANFTKDRNARSTVYTQDALVGFETCKVVAVNIAVPTFTAI